MQSLPATYSAQPTSHQAHCFPNQVLETSSICNMGMIAFVSFIYIMHVTMGGKGGLSIWYSVPIMAKSLSRVAVEVEETCVLVFCPG